MSTDKLIAPKLNQSVDYKLSNCQQSNPIEYKVTVQQVINSNRKVVDDFGIAGYYLPKFDAKLDKSVSFMVPKTKVENFIAIA